MRAGQACQVRLREQEAEKPWSCRFTCWRLWPGASHLLLHKPAFKQQDALEVEGNVPGRHTKSPFSLFIIPARLHFLKIKEHCLARYTDWLEAQRMWTLTPEKNKPQEAPADEWLFHHDFSVLFDHLCGSYPITSNSQAGAACQKILLSRQSFLAGSIYIKKQCGKELIGKQSDYICNPRRPAVTCYLQS